MVNLTRTGNDRKRRLITSTILMFIGALFCAGGYWINLGGQELEANGIETTATISNKKKVKRRSSNATGATKYNRGSTRFLVRYRFTTKDGHHSDRKSVSRAFFDSVKFGDKVPVRYIEADPSQNEIEFGAYNTNSWIAGGIGAAIFLLGAVFFYLPQKNSNSQKFGRKTEVKKDLA